MKNCLKYTLKFCCSPIAKRRSRNLGTLWDRFVPLFSIFHDMSPRLEDKRTLRCSSDYFPRLVTYILCVESFHYYMLMHNCLKIQDTVLECTKMLCNKDLSVHHMWLFCFCYQYYSYGNMSPSRWTTCMFYIIIFFSLMYFLHRSSNQFVPLAKYSTHFMVRATFSNAKQ